MSQFIIYCLLTFLGLSMISLLVCLLLKLNRYRPSETAPLKARLMRFLQEGRLEDDSRLRWLNREVELVGGDVTRLRRSCETIRDRVEWLYHQIPTVANAAMGLGFVGTVLSLVSAAGQNADLTETIGFGMKTTYYGMMIAIPGTVFYGLTSQRISRLMGQVDEVLDALDEYATPRRTDSSSIPPMTNLDSHYVLTAHVVMQPPGSDAIATTSDGIAKSASDSGKTQQPMSGTRNFHQANGKTGASKANAKGH